MKIIHSFGSAAATVVGNPDGPAIALAEARLALARAMLASGLAPSRARRLIRQARDAYRGLDRPDLEAIAAVDALLAGGH